MKHFLGILILFSGLSYAEDTNNGKGSIEVLESLISESLKNKHDKTHKELRESSERHDKVNAKDILLFCDENDKKLDLKKRFFFIISTEVKYGFLEYYDYGTLYRYPPVAVPVAGDNGTSSFRGELQNQSYGNGIYKIYTNERKQVCLYI